MTTTDVPSDLATYDLFVDGAWVPPTDGRTMSRTSPFDGREVGSYAKASAARGRPGGRRRAACVRRDPVADAPQHRFVRRVLRRAAELLRERADAIGRRISLELGKPIALARNEVLLTAEVFDYYAALDGGRARRGDLAAHPERARA